jgi:membrane protein
MTKPARDIWVKLDILMSRQRSFIRIIYDSLRIFLLVHSTIRATALVYTSLLAVVPLVILLTTISLALGVGDLFITHLPLLLPDILEKIEPYINNVLQLFSQENKIELKAMSNILLENIMPFLEQAKEIKLGSLGVIGGVGLLVTFILAIDNIETNMNIAWGVTESRGYGQKAIIFIPFLLLFAIGIGIFSIFLSNIRDILEKILVQELPFGKFGELLVNLSIPIVLMVLALVALWLLYCYMPYVRESIPSKNGFLKAFLQKTKDRWFAALISAVFTFAAASIFIAAMAILQASMMAKWSLFYGSLAVYPMIMLLLFGFWCIVLFGNALCWRITKREENRPYFYNIIKDLKSQKGVSLKK